MRKEGARALYNKFILLFVNSFSVLSKIAKMTCSKKMVFRSTCSKKMVFRSTWCHKITKSNRFTWEDHYSFYLKPTALLGAISPKIPMHASQTTTSNSSRYHHMGRFGAQICGKAVKVLKKTPLSGFRPPRMQCCRQICLAIVVDS